MSTRADRRDRSDHTDSTAIVGATIIDGNGGAPLRDGVLVTQGSRIVYVGHDVRSIPASARRIDGRGKYLIPGLMDANVHLVFGFTTEFMVLFEERLEPIIRESAQIALKSGVTTVFDTWGPLEELQAVRDEINRGSLQASRIFCAGNIVGLGGPFSDDFYASDASVRPETVRRINARYEQGVGHELLYAGPTQLRGAIQAYLAKGIDFLKYAVSGHARRDWGFLLFSPRAQEIIIEETHAKGLTVQSHTTSIESLNIAIDAGVDLLQHPQNVADQPLPAALLEKAAQMQIPGAIAFEPQRYLDHVLGSNWSTLPQQIPDPRQRTWVTITQNARRWVQAGARVIMMTDGGVAQCGCPLVYAPIRDKHYPEIEQDATFLFGNGPSAWLRGAIDAGLSPMEALAAATKNVAAAYQKLDDLGTLEPGKLADIVVLSKDPLANPEHYRQIDVVIKEGEVVDREALPNEAVLSRSQVRR